MGKDNLAHNIRMILDYYPRLAQSKLLDETEKRILKAILLFQAMSMEMHDSVELFHANEKNLNNAFEGSDLENGEAVRCAEKLVRDGVIYKKKLKGENTVYSILTGEMDSNKIDEYKKSFEDKQTSSLIVEGNLSESIEVPIALRLRYEFEFAGSSDLDQKAKRLISSAANNNKKIYSIVTFSKDANEAAVINKKIHTILSDNPETSVIFVDTSKNMLGDDAFNSWVENKATAYYFAKSDHSQSQQYETYASDVLKKWKDAIRNGQFIVYTSSLPGGDNKANMESLVSALFDEDKKLFPLGLENYKIHDPLWTATMLKVGVECGVTQKVKSTYSNQKKVEKALEGAWEVDNYWTIAPSLQISRIKIALNSLVEDTMEREGRISIKAIYDYLKDTPFGFMPCNFTAFILGFLLKEYINDGKYTWSDGLSSDELSLDKFKDMVDEVIKLDNTPNNRYREKYIVTMTPEEKSFIEATSKAFDISKSLCSSLEQSRERIRARMKEFAFPIWTLNYILKKETIQSEEEIISDLINLYCGIANNNPAESGKSENDIAIEIGKICMNNPTAVDDLKLILSKDKCTAGMVAYLKEYSEGELVELAEKVQDGGQYINAIRMKFDADAANWVWKKNTVDQKIEEVICEYKIIVETSNLFSSCKSYEEALHTWSERCNNMRLSYQAIKNDVGELDNLLSKLNDLRRDGKIQEVQKSDFLSCIKDYGENFKQLYSNQLSIFTKVAAFYLSELTDADKDSVFKLLSSGCFTKDKAAYFQDVEKIVDEYKKQLGSQKLKQFWKEKTNTASPYEWSSKYKMPILIMVPEDKLADYRKHFGTIAAKNPDSNAIESAQLFFDASNIWDGLNDASIRDKKFRDIIIGDKSVMLKDINEVKD